MSFEHTFVFAGAHRGRRTKSAKVDTPNPVSDLGSDADEVHDAELWNAWESSHIAEPLFIFLNHHFVMFLLVSEGSAC